MAEAPRHDAVTVRTARSSDAQGVLDLLVSEELEAEFARDEFRVAVVEGRLAGCARLRPLRKGVSELASVAVAADMRGKGVGRALVKETLARADGTVYALALEPAFFARMGFRRIPHLPAELREKAEGLCKDAGYVAMMWGP